LRTYQMALDDSMLSVSDIAVNPGPVAENFPWEVFEPVRKRYEDARFRHLKKQTKKTKGQTKRKRGRPPTCERKLLIIAEENIRECDDESPGSGGFPAYDFYPLLSAFLISPLYDCEPNAESIWRELQRNPSFASLCGFDAGDIPSPRTLRRFNRIMAEEGLWEEARRIAVEHNLEEGVIAETGSLIVDTTHHDGFASVHKPVKACRECKRIKGCKEPVHTCDVTDIVAKSRNYRLPGVKTVVLSLAGSEIPIGALAMNARAHDSQSLAGALELIKRDYPDLDIDKVIADGAYDGKACRKNATEVLGADLVTPVCPRRNQKKKVDARGIDHVDTYGRPVCISGHQMELLGRDIEREQYIWACPAFHPLRSDETVNCEMWEACCPRAANGRVYRTNAAEFPQVHWDLPQHSRTHKRLYAMRTQVERIISRVKRVLSFERFYGRGKKALQGFADRYVTVFNIIAFVAWST
jgi:hypothetical protein